jgi:hypothetical protein
MYSRRRWRQVAYLSEIFWHRWRKEYITVLQSRHKWQQVCRNIKGGDVVLLYDENVARSRWILGRVLEVQASSADGLVRSATVKTADGVLTRPVTKMCFLEEHDS